MASSFNRLQKARYKSYIGHERDWCNAGINLQTFFLDEKSIEDGRFYVNEIDIVILSSINKFSINIVWYNVKNPIF